MGLSVIWVISEKLTSTKEGVFPEHLWIIPHGMPVYIVVLNHPEEPFIIFILFSLGTGFFGFLIIATNELL